MHWPTQSEIDLLPSDGGDTYNRLIFEDSLYLKQHAHQKIQWYAWGKPAFELANITQKPVFLSIGYSACHWCHVMSHTTFDHPEVARLLNESFVSIKVDRDQHPDIDQVYMAATQLLTQHGGWPNSVFCLPTGQPFFAGTYYPATDSPDGRSGFITLLTQLAQSWQHQHDAIVKQAQELERVIIQMNTVDTSMFQTTQLKGMFQQSQMAMHQQLDVLLGHLAPKFPPFSSIRLCLKEGSSDAIAKVHAVLTAMATSGLRDYIQGGFHRYCVDSKWHLPHFEKMLTDQAQMIELYSLAYKIDPKPIYRQVVLALMHHLDTDWRRDDGVGYMASIDADSEGIEGHYYVMRLDELMGVFDSPEDAQVWVDYFQFTKEGNALDEATGEPTGYNVFHPKTESLPQGFDDFCKRITQFRRQHRQAPSKDSRLVISQQGLLIKAMLIASDVFQNQDWQTKATQLFTQVMALIQAQLDQVYVDDVLYVLDASLHCPSLSNDSQALFGILMDRFYDPVQHGVWFSQLTHQTPMTRIKDVFDRATPSANGLLIQVCAKMAPMHLDCFRVLQQSIPVFLGQLNQSYQGADSFWLGILYYWELVQPANQVLRVHYASVRPMSANQWHVILDIEVTGQLVCSAPFSVQHHPHAKWLMFQVDPTKARRMADGSVEQCATGMVRVDGRLSCSSCESSIQLQAIVCASTQCEPVQIPLHLPKFVDS